MSSANSTCKPGTKLATFSPAVDAWLALRTSARWEKKIAASLMQSGVPVFLPTMTRVVQYVGKKQRSEVPIFSGYLFCDESLFIGNPRVSSTCRNQIAQVLRPGDQDQLKRELSRIADLVEHHELIQERLYGSPGDRVRIIAGPLSGSQATVVALKPRKRVIVLEVSFLGVRLEVEVEEHQVEKEI